LKIHLLLSHKRLFRKKKESSQQLPYVLVRIFGFCIDAEKAVQSTHGPDTLENLHPRLPQYPIQCNIGTSQWLRIVRQSLRSCMLPVVAFVLKLHTQVPGSRDSRIITASNNLFHGTENIYLSRHKYMYER
jgi:hypothetical protein